MDSSLADVPLPPGAPTLPRTQRTHRGRRAAGGFFIRPTGSFRFHVGYYQRGFIHAIVVSSLIAMLAADIGPLTPLAALFLAFFWLYNIVDAGRRALLYNEALAGRSGIELPEDFKMPALRGSIPGGIAIVAAGGVLLSHTRFRMPLDWLNEWWPVALIVFGIYLVARSVMSPTPKQAKL